MELNSLVPLAYVRSVRQSLDFYRKLGFEVGNTHTPEGATEPVWAWLRSGGAHLMIGQASAPVDPRSQAVLFYIYCPDLETFREELIKADIRPGPILCPFYAPLGEFRVTDPDGYVLMISHA